MARTQTERLEAIEAAQEALHNQQRILIMQNDKVLEFMDAIYAAMAQEAQQEEPPPMPTTESGAEAIKTMLKDLSGDDEPNKPSASRSWGRGMPDDN